MAKSINLAAAASGKNVWKSESRKVNKVLLLDLFLNIIIANQQFHIYFFSSLFGTQKTRNNLKRKENKQKLKQKKEREASAKRTFDWK